MSELAVRAASPAQVRSIQARRDVDDLTMRLTLAAAERGTAYAALDDGETVGVAVAWDSGEERLVGDLFVEPSYRGQGVGSRLMDAAFETADDRARAVVLAENDAAATALALRRGMAPVTAVLRLAGAIPREEVLMKLAAGDYRFDVDAIDPQRHGAGLDALDRETRGTTRSSDHETLAGAAVGQAFFYNGEMVAYAYVWPDGRIGPVAFSSAAYGVQLFGFIVVSLQRAHGASWCTALVPASNLRVARAALRAGLRIEQTFSIARDVRDADLSRYIGYSTILF